MTGIDSCCQLGWQHSESRVRKALDREATLAVLLLVKPSQRTFKQIDDPNPDIPSSHT